MAINVSQETAAAGPVRVIAKIDDAIDPAASDWDAYKETRDEAKLVLLPGKAPTVFLCSFAFDAKAARMVNNAMLASKDESGQPSMSYGTWSQTIAKVSLREIENPADLPEAAKLVMRKDAAGYVHDDLLAKLERWGIIDDIFSAYITTQKKKVGAADSKN